MRTPQGLEIRVGLLIILGVAATVVMIMLSDKLSFDSYYHINIYLDDAGGLRSGSPVTLSGIGIGSVTTIDTSDDPLGQIVVGARIKQSVKIPQGAVLSMSSSGIFGDSFLAFTSQSRGSSVFLATDGSAKVKAAPSFMGQATEQAKDILATLSTILDKQTAANAKRVIANAADISGSASGLVAHLESQDHKIDELIENLQAISANLKQTTASINKHSDAITNHLDSTLSTIDQNVQTMATHANTAIDKLSSVATQADDIISLHRQDIAALIDNLRTLSTHAAAISGAIDSGQGVLGKLIFSRDLAKQVDTIAIDFAVAAKMLNEHPSALVWGPSSKETREANAYRTQLTQEQNFHQDFGDPANATGAKSVPAAH